VHTHAHTHAHTYTQTHRHIRRDRRSSRACSSGWRESARLVYKSLAQVMDDSIYIYTHTGVNPTVCDLFFVMSFSGAWCHSWLVRILARRGPLIYMYTYICIHFVQFYHFSRSPQLSIQSYHFISFLFRFYKLVNTRCDTDLGNTQSAPRGGERATVC